MGLKRVVTSLYHIFVSLPFHVSSFSSAIDACGNGGQLELALILFNSMDKAGVTPNEV